MIPSLASRRRPGAPLADAPPLIVSYILDRQDRTEGAHGEFDGCLRFCFGSPIPFGRCGRTSAGAG